MLEDKSNKKIEEWLRKSGYTTDTPNEKRLRLINHYLRQEERKRLRKQSQYDRWMGNS